MDALVISKLTIQGVKGVVIHDGILETCISTPAFLTIPKGVIMLNDGCLSGQDNLEVLTLPRTLEKIGDFVLANCPNLRLVRCPEHLRGYEKFLVYGNNAEVRYVSANKYTE